MLFEIQASGIKYKTNYTVRIMTAKFKLKRLSFKCASRNHAMLRESYISR